MFLATYVLGDFTSLSPNTTCKEEDDVSLHCVPKENFTSIHWNIHYRILNWTEESRNGNNSLTLPCQMFTVQCVYTTNNSIKTSPSIYISRGKKKRRSQFLPILLRG